MSAAVLLEDPSMYVPPDKPWELKLRSRESFKAELSAVVRLWKLYAEARGDDASQIDISYVIRSMLETGVQAAFGEFGRRPTTEEHWKAIADSIAKTVKKQR